MIVRTAAALHSAAVVAGEFRTLAFCSRNTGRNPASVRVGRRRVTLLDELETTEEIATLIFVDAVMIVEGLRCSSFSLDAMRSRGGLG